MIMSWYPEYLWYSLAPTFYLSKASHRVDTCEILNQKEESVIGKLTKEKISAQLLIATVHFGVLAGTEKFKVDEKVRTPNCILFASHLVL